MDRSLEHLTGVTYLYGVFFSLSEAWLILWPTCLQPEKITIPVQAHGGEEDGFEVGVLIFKLHVLWSSYADGDACTSWK